MNDHLAQASALRAQPLPMRLTLSYSAGQIVDSVINTALSTYLLFYVTAVCGLSPALAGLALGAGIVVDALLDPFIGSSSDAMRSRYGRRLPFMLIGLPLTAAAFVLIFSLPKGMDQTLLCGWVTLLSIVLRVSGSLFHLPYQAVGAEMTDHYAGRSALMAWRFGVGTIGGVGAIGLGAGLFFTGEDGLSRHESYFPYAASMAALTVTAGLLACRAIYVTRDRHHPPVVSAEKFHVRFRSEILEIFRSKSFLALLSCAVLFFAGLGVHAALSVHTGTFFWKLNSTQIQAMALALPVGLFIGVPIAALLLKSIEKRIALSAGLAGIGVAMAVAPVARVLGFLPLEGDALVVLLGGIAFLAGGVASLAAIAIASMLADSVDEHEFLYGSRREGMYFAAWIFAGKAAAGIGSIVAGLVLQGIGFPSGVTTLEQAPDLPNHTITLLGLCGGPIGGVFLIASAFSATRYRLNAQKHAEILSTLRARTIKSDGSVSPQAI